jgi:hypothetical protein
MEVIDKIIFGDNQFFGINHMSQEKAQQLSEQFFDIDNIYKVYQMAFDCGIKAVMLNSNDRAQEICNHFRSKASVYGDISFYPSIPYPHKYANLITEKGILPAINSIIFKENSAKNIFGMIAQGGMAVISKDVISLMKMLVDIEMKMFKSLNVRVVFLQNIVTDLILGLDIKEIFYEYSKHVRKKYNAIPGLITQNLPLLRQKLVEWGIDEVVICSSYNKIGYLMSPNVESYMDVAKANDPKKYQLMAMSTLASGAISPKVAYEFINSQQLQSVVFGASSKKHIEETVSLIKL